MFSLIFSSIALLLILLISHNQIVLGYNNSNNSKIINFTNSIPTLNSSNLQIELVVGGGINFPTSFAFLGKDDILVLEKNNGIVKRILNGTILKEPLLDVNVSTKFERGMLGIAISKNNTNNSVYVFLYYTQSSTKDGDDVTDGLEPLGNRLYRYELVENKLVNPKLLLDLPGTPGPTHNGGKIAIGPDNNVYLTTGSIGTMAETRTQTQNVKEGPIPDGRGGILRVTQDGHIPNEKIFDKFPMSIYYAYGIRNSFGLDFDPVTGNLWDSENGPYYGDEINLVEPGFNSGFTIIQGFWINDSGQPGKFTTSPSNLVDFESQGKYSSPEFSWYNFPVGPTGLKFLNSDKLGKEYENDMFVGDFHRGNIYHFKLDDSRTSLHLSGNLTDKIANNMDELDGVIFGKGFGGITDIAIGPDGYIYILSIYQGGDNCEPKHFGNSNTSNSNIEIKKNDISCIHYDSTLDGSILRIKPLN